MKLSQITKALADWEAAEARGEPLPEATYHRLRRMWMDKVRYTSLISPIWKSHVPENRGKLLKR